MISFKQFKKYMEFIKDYEEKLNKANDALINISSEFTGIYGIAAPIIDKYVYMLTDLMELDKADPDLLWWWMYERDFGKNTAEVTLNRKTYQLDTLEKLYNFIVKSVKNYNKKVSKKK